MRAPQPDPGADSDAIAADPRWLAHRFDGRADSFGFVFIPREVHRETGFLNDQYIAPELARVVLPRRAVAAAPKRRAPLHFIFHSGLACSTLLARALDREGAAAVLKEPAILTDVVAYGLGAPDAADRSRALGDVLDLLARPFEAGEPVIVKTASVANGLGEAMLASRPDSKAICLYAPLPVFLASIARKGLMGRLWGRRLFIGLRNAGMADLGFTDREHFGQTDLQIAACAWLAQHFIFARLLARHGARRVRTIDSESLMANLLDVFAAIAAHFPLALDAAAIAEIIEAPVFRRHSKSGETYDARRRVDELEAAHAAHRDEIEKVSLWAEKVAEAAGFQLSLGTPLLA